MSARNVVRWYRVWQGDCQEPWLVVFRFLGKAEIYSKQTKKKKQWCSVGLDFLWGKMREVTRRTRRDDCDKRQFIRRLQGIGRGFLSSPETSEFAKWSTWDRRVEDDGERDTGVLSVLAKERELQKGRCGILAWSVLQKSPLDMSYARFTCWNFYKREQRRKITQVEESSGV